MYFSHMYKIKTIFYNRLFHGYPTFLYLFVEQHKIEKWRKKIGVVYRRHDCINNALPAPLAVNNVTSLQCDYIIFDHIIKQVCLIKIVKQSPFIDLIKPYHVIVN